MGLEPYNSRGQTPLDEEEAEGLRFATITTRGELDEFEQKNIEEAILWTLKRSFRLDQVLSEKFILDLHKRMYGEVWLWAGQFRKTNKNLGVDWHKIKVELRQLLGDTTYWISNQVYPPDEITMRFKHRLVSIHCFPNGNGRHSRLMADLISYKIFGQNVFTWGSDHPDSRKRYLKALKLADKGDIRSLVIFARS